MGCCIALASLAIILFKTGVIVAYIKVLVVNGEPFNSISATGITMSNLFRGWPTENIFQIYTANIDPDIELCRNNIRLSSVNLKPFNYLVRIAGVFFSRNNSVSLNSKVNEGVQNAFLFKRVLSKIRMYLSPFLDFFPYQLNEIDLVKIRNFNPDAIYSMLGSLRMVRLVSSLANELGIPVVPHFMDDWLSTYAVPGRSLGSPVHTCCLQSRVNDLFKYVPIGMSIGELMAKEYSHKFSCKFEAFMNPVEVRQWGGREIGFDNSRPLRFVYVGGLHLGREEALSDIACALQKFKIGGFDVELFIYTPIHDAMIARKMECIGAVVVYKGSISPTEVQEVLEQSDVAIHVESFSDSCSEYTRLSVSTKIPQYFAAGIPVLAYGPLSLASCQYIKSTSSGVVVDKSRGGDLENEIFSLISGRELRKRLGMQGWLHARAHHDVVAVRERFMRTLASAAASYTKRTSV